MIVKKMKQQKAFKKPPSAHGRDLIRYILTARAQDAEKKETLLCAGTLNMNEDNPARVDSIIAESVAIAAEAPRVANPYVHFVLSPSEEDANKITPETAPLIARRFCELLEVPQLSCVFGVHDGDNRHLHLAINRIDPVTGQRVDIAGRYDIKAAHKAMATIEKEFGFRVNENSLYICNENGDPLKNPNHKRGVSDRGREEEARTGKESAERKILGLAQVLKDARTWEEVHAKLAEQKAKYEKTPRGGAVISIGKTHMKASTVDRAASINNMEKRLGPFRPAGAEVENVPQQKFSERPISFLVLLLAYIFILIGFHRSALNLLKAEYDRTRKDYESRGWKGKGKELNAVRAAHATEYRDNKNSLRREFKNKVKAAKKMDEKTLCKFVKDNATDPEIKKYAIKYEREKFNVQENNMETPKIQGNAFSDPVTQEERDHYMSAFLKIDNALKADLYHWTSKDDHQDIKDSEMSETQQEKIGTFTFGKKYAMQNSPEKISSTGAFVGWTREETIQQYSQMIRKNREIDRGTYIMPKSEKVHYILIDDIKTPEQKKAAKEFSSAVVVESSRGNFQCILKIHSYAENAEIAKAAANRTITEINRLEIAEGQTLGDPKIVKCLQAWRAPLFENHKPKHRNDAGEYPVVKLHLAQDVFCTKAQEIYDRHVQELLQEQQQAPARTTTTAKAKTEGKTYEAPIAEIKAPAHAEQLYRLHATDILKRRPSIEGHEIDHHTAQRLLATGHTPEETTAILIKGAPAFRPDRTHEWNSYIPPTVNYAAQNSASFASSYSGLVRLWRNWEMQIIENGKTADEILKKAAEKKKSLSR